MYNGRPASESCSLFINTHQYPLAYLASEKHKQACRSADHAFLVKLANSSIPHLIRLKDHHTGPPPRCIRPGDSMVSNHHGEESTKDRFLQIPTTVMY